MADRNLDADGIVDAAIELALAEGIDAVSMRRVGASLGVSGMALYRYVTDRDDLVARMAARVSRGLRHELRDSPDWRSTLQRLADSEWDAFARHPWLIDVAVSPTRLIDATTNVDTESILSRLVAAGVPAQRAGDLLVGVAALVVGIARLTLTAEPARTIDYAADRIDAQAPADPAGLAARFRAEPLDAARGRRLLDTSLSSLLDGVAASLPARPADRPTHHPSQRRADAQQKEKS